MNKGEKKIVPQLRFPEFVKDGDWNNTELGKCLLKHPEYGIGAVAVPYSEKLPTYLRITDITVDGKFIKDGKVSVSKKVTEDNYLKEGDIVFARTGASVGKSYKYRVEDGRLVFAGFLLRVKPNTNKLNSELLFQFVSTEQYWKWVKFVSARSGQPGINGKQYASMPILLPPKKDEQQKIANCLSSLDNVITAENEKLDLLKDHKKGLLQQLFPTEGETQPQYRFPEFVNEGDWVETTLGDKDFAVIIMGSSPKSSSYNENKIGLPLLQGNADIKKRKSKPRIYTTEITNECEIDDILLSVRAPVGTVAKSLHIACIGRGISAIRVINKNSQEFLYQWLISFEPYWKNISQGGTFDSVNSNDIKSLRIPLPKDPKEQQKIAHCLSSVDELIEIQEQKIENLKAHKKGLMQQLFPEPGRRVFPTINELAI